jgi:hypothetical protein
MDHTHKHPGTGGKGLVEEHLPTSPFHDSELPNEDLNRVNNNTLA